MRYFSRTMRTRSTRPEPISRSLAADKHQQEKNLHVETLERELKSYAS